MPPPIADTIYVGHVPSVLDTARTYNLPEWGSVLAHSQSAGRGQMCRPWHSPPGNIYGAVRLPMTAPFVGTEAAPALGGMLVAILRDRFADTGVDIRLKWPNDVVIVHNTIPHKCGGILLEERGGVLLAGIGINIVSAPTPHLLSPKYALPALCLGDVMPMPTRLWQHLVHGFVFWYTYGLQATGWQTLAEKHLLWRGRAVVLEEDSARHRPQHGILLGLGVSGSARMRVDGHIVEFLSGTLRGADGIHQ